MIMQPQDETSPVDVEKAKLEKQKLAEKHMPMAYKIAATFSKNWRWLKDEFESEALLALVEAANTFDPSYNVQFKSFASIRIKGALTTFRRKMTQSRLVSTPDEENQTGEERPKEWTHTKASSNLSPNEVAEYLHKQEIATYSIDQLEAMGALEELKQYIKRLPKRHRAVISAFYVERRDADEIASDTKYTKERLRAIHREAINMISTGEALPDVGKCRKRHPNRLKISMPETSTKMDGGCFED